jgi:hypothetical protein
MVRSTEDEGDRVASLYRLCAGPTTRPSVLTYHNLPRANRRRVAHRYSTSSANLCR